MRKNALISGIAVVSAVVLGACDSTAPMSTMDHSSSTPAPAPAGEHNADDVVFAQQMVPHHSQALDMAKLVPSRSTNPKVIDLASRIAKAQDPEIQLMRTWLTTWGAGSAMPGMTHEPMPGMLSGAELTQLEAAKGAEFDKMWLDMMIQHHQGAIDMAGTELSRGANADAKALARKIVDAQQAEISEMRGLRTQG